MAHEIQTVKFDHFVQPFFGQDSIAVEKRVNTSTDVPYYLETLSTIVFESPRGLRVPINFYQVPTTENRFKMINPINPEMGYQVDNEDEFEISQRRKQHKLSQLEESTYAGKFIGCQTIISDLVEYDLPKRNLSQWRKITEKLHLVVRYKNNPVQYVSPIEVGINTELDHFTLLFAEKFRPLGRPIFASRNFPTGYPLIVPIDYSLAKMEVLMTSNIDKHQQHQLAL